MIKKFLYGPIYPFLLPVFIVLSLYAKNVSEVEWTVIFRPMLVLLFAAVLIFLIFRKVHHDSSRSALLTLGILVSFLSYGSIYLFLKTRVFFGFNLARHSLLGPLWIVLITVFIIIISSKKVKIGPNVSLFFNIVLVFLLLSPSYASIQNSKNDTPVITGSGSASQVRAQADWLAGVQEPLTVPSTDTLPDIYYIIPDMFARSDAIQQETGYDNAAFLQALRNLGFYVADCSRSNYASTQLSIASSLNLNYLDQIQDGMTSRPDLKEPTRNSLLRSSLESLGYQTVVFSNGFGLPEIPDADVTLAHPSRFLLFQPLNPFENLLVGNSVLRVFYDVNLGFVSNIYDRIFFPYREHVQAQKYIFDRLPQLQDIQSPKLVFAHIMAPHPPFLIHEDGSVETDSRYYREALAQPVTEELYLAGYLMQVKYIQTRLLETVEQIIANSTVDPVIIIQGDHGIRDENRLNILNAYYVPASVRQNLYPAITPVNTFRLVLNGLYGTHYDLLPDQSWMSLYPDWFNMRLDPETSPACNSNLPD